MSVPLSIARVRQTLGALAGAFYKSCSVVRLCNKLLIATPALQHRSGAIPAMLDAFFRDALNGHHLAFDLKHLRVHNRIFAGAIVT